MRVILDTNIIISALLVANSKPAELIAMWRQGKFDLLMCNEQLDELRRVTQYPKIRERLSPPLAGRLINQIKELSVSVVNLPDINLSEDPSDNFLLAMAIEGSADYLITGDISHLLHLKKVMGTSIISVTDFLSQY
jgi:putative PIN family toxin of toxin-antitoxin system